MGTVPTSLTCTVASPEKQIPPLGLVGAFEEVMAGALVGGDVGNLVGAVEGGGDALPGTVKTTTFPFPNIPLSPKSRTSLPPISA